MGSEGVPQRVWRSPLGQSSVLAGFREGLACGVVGHRTDRRATGEQPQGRPCQPPVVAEHPQQPGRQQRVPLTTAFGVADMDEHQLGSRGRRSEGGRLR